MATENKPKFQPWNEEEFQADVYVRGMSHVQRWMYRALLQAAFFHGTRPYLPTDDEVLWVLAGCESPEQWQENKAKIMRRFTPVDGFPDLMQNKRVVADWANLQNIREQAAEQGREGGLKSAEVRRQRTGTAQPGFRPPIVSNPPSNPGSNPPSAESADPRSGPEAREEKRREVKLSEEKGSEEKQAAGQPASSSQGKHTGGDWKTIAVKCKRQFGRIPGDSRSKDNYAEACFKYGEDVVLAAFDDWAPGAGWVKEKGYDPLRMFLKALPDLAEVLAADKELTVAEDTQRAADAAKALKDQANREQQIAAARKADADKWDSMSKPSTENEVSLADYLEEDTLGQKQ